MRPLSVVVSAETGADAYEDEMKKAGVLRFYPKAKFDAEKYLNVSKAALWYLAGEALLSKHRIEAARKSCGKAKHWANKAEIDAHDFPMTKSYEDVLK